MATESPTMKLLKQKGKKVEVEAPQAEDVSPAAVEKVKPAAKPKKAAPKAAAKTKKVVESDLIVNVVKEVEGLDQDSVESTVKSLLEVEGENDFKLGGCFNTIRENKWYLEFADTFRDYVEDVFGVPYRKAMYLSTMYGHLVESGVDWDKVKDVGWTKLKEIAPLITPKNVDTWVQRCQKMSHIQLREYIKKLSEKNGGDIEEGEAEVSTATLTTFTIKLHDDQKELVKSALEQARNEYETEYDSVALEHIVTTYLEGKTGKAKIPIKQFVTVMGEMGPEKAVEVFEKAFPGMSMSVDIEP